MEFFRVGDKIISLSKINKGIQDILKMRSHGSSQQEAAEVLGVDRSFISRLENLGEIRKGKNIGIIGFPIKNKEDIYQFCNERGIENCLLMNELERQRFVDEKTGSDLVNEIMALLREYRKFDTVIVLASDKRNRLIEALFDHQVITIDIGNSPLTADVEVNMEKIREIVDNLS